ncbi:GNAT family N-acetyltransferase [Streptomyces sp. NPDC057302]|uniref:GNAT family N-acetyltransferase n=1 Tax=Streptomyces sp. NPDC057302 TaxID=3346094 RepID=UPI003631E115
MIQLSPRKLPALARWFPAGAPGTASLPEHAFTTGVGTWWADQALNPRVVAVSCAGHVLLRGAPEAVDPAGLAPFAGSHVEALARFLPVLGAAFERIVPAERMLYVHAEPASASTPAPPRDTTVRRLVGTDAPALAALTEGVPDTAWIHDSWGGAEGLAASGHGWAAFDRNGRIASVACGYFAGDAYEDVAVVTAPEHRREGLALACVTALCGDIAARGRTASWSCARDNRPSRLLAWTAGFRLQREYVHYVTGRASVPSVPSVRPAPKTTTPLPWTAVPATTVGPLPRPTQPLPLDSAP